MNLTHESIKQQWRAQVQKIRHLAAYCQACLYEKEYKDDPILTCGICDSSIHLSHYGYEIVGKTTNKNHVTANLDDWRCQRCRYLVERKFSVQVKCEFCPFPRGIMKKVIFEPSPNHRKQIWVHPQCTTWCFPLIWMQSKKRTHYFKEVPQTPTTKFWFRVEEEPNKKCVLCCDNYGYKIKCSFYSCTKFYHITCAKKIGVVRDLESMRFQQSNDNYCPVYCQQHLEGMVLDFAQKVKLYTQKKDSQKIAHFTKVHNCYKIQLKNLTTAAKKVKQEEEIRNQFGKQLMIASFEESSMSLSISQLRSNEIASSESQSSHSDTFLAFLENSYELKDLNELLMKKQQRQKDSENYQKVSRKRDSKTEKKITKRANKVEEKMIKAESNRQNEKHKQMQMEAQQYHEINQEQKQLILQQKYIQGAYAISSLNQKSQIPEMMEEESEEESISRNQLLGFDKKKEKSEGQISIEGSDSPSQRMEQEFVVGFQPIELCEKSQKQKIQEGQKVENPEHFNSNP